MTTLVMGATGLLGRALLRELGSEATGTAMTRSGPGLVQVDARTSAAVLDLAKAVQPEVIVNLIAERRPTQWADQDQLYRSNVATAMNCADAARLVGAALVHISTDYVFPSGGPFAPDDPHAPMNAYGQTKSVAESEVRRILPAAIIVRMPVLYGPVTKADECNLSELVTRIAGAQGPVALDSWARRRPTHVADVARSLAAISRAAARWEGRAIHVSAPGWYSQYEMGLRVAELLHIDPELMRPEDKPSADRPRQVDLALEPDAPFLPEYRPLTDGLPPLIDNYLAARGSTP